MGLILHGKVMISSEEEKAGENLRESALRGGAEGKGGTSRRQDSTGGGA